MMNCIVRAAVTMALLCVVVAGRGQVIINEIMYHPSSENVLEEYIELHNRAGTNVNLGGWRFSNGVEFTFAPNTILPANGYLVVAAHRQTFTNKYPGVLNVVGNWVGILSNTRNDIDLDDAGGNRIDSVEYADEGDWAIRQRGPLDRGFRGWVWYKEHDGLGKSLELINPALPNEHGQNWAASTPVNGTPGAANSVLDSNIAPMILQAGHFPVVPTPADAVTISARLLDESTVGLSAILRWRVDGASSFSSATMFDDGAHGDGAAADGIWAAILSAQPNNTVVEFYIEASDAQSNTRTWPAPTIPATDGDPEPGGQRANALYQVDDNPLNVFGGVPSQQPVYKMIFTEAERVELASIPGQSNNQGPNSQMNGTFVSLDSSGPSLHYLVGVRNRGHASRTANPPNYRVNFRSDDRWQGVTAINFNSREVHIQHFGSVQAIKSGSAGSYSRAAQVRVNNQNRASSGAPMFGSYAANEVYNNEWAERHYPNDGGGNVYKAVRDLGPPEFDYRTEAAYPSAFYPRPPSPAANNFVNFGPEDSRTYTNTFYKETNVSEDDWTDLIGMVRVMGRNGTDDFTEASVRQVINVEEWLTHLAVMCLMGNAESGLNDGHNDDYYMYSGAIDRRFVLMHHDLDQILGVNSRPTTDGLFGMMNSPPRGSQDIGGVGLMMQRFLSTNYVFRAQYLQTLQHLLNTTFSAAQFDAAVDQTLGGYVPPATRNSLKSWMSGRRAHVQGLLGANSPIPGVATISGEPRSPTPLQTATLTIGGNDVVSYRFRLNNGSYGAERPVSQQIVFPSLGNGTTNTVYVIGKTSAGGWQSTANPTPSKTWVVNTAWPGVRINEVLADNVSAINHNGSFPDVIELYNEGSGAVDLSGMRLTDDPAEPNKYTFPQGTSLGAGQYLALYANEIGFSLDATGEGVYLYHRIANGGALLDSVQFGVQLPDRSIGRTGNGIGSWALCQPTEGAVNTAIPTVAPYSVRINEWLTAPQSPFGDDFIELYNPTAAPVDIGGLFLTDTPIGAPNRHRIPDLTFIPAGGFFVFTADGNNDPEHVNFQLSSDLGEIALVAPGRVVIDCVSYGPQRPGISMGRCPDGALNITHLVLPTPGSPNACPSTVTPNVVALFDYTNVWRYMDGGTNIGSTWMATNYNDGWWPSGPGLLGLDNDPQPEPIRTPFFSPISGKLAFYFRTRFVLPPGLQVSQLSVTHLIDDGAIFYLNGQEVGPRFNMPNGPVDYLTPANGTVGLSTSYNSFEFVPPNLQPGTNFFAVEVHQAAANSPDIVFGLKLDALIITNTPGGAGVVINEVFANNGTFAEADGSTPDWVEFYNPSDTAVDLAGFSLSDSTLNPDRFVFSAGSIVPAQGYFSIRCDADRPASPTNTGFGLKASGDSVYLFNPNNTVLTNVAFGIQAADFSIGRIGGNWTLCLPTIGSANIGTTFGNVMLLRINEWMADPEPGEDDYIEIYNPNAQPVAVGGCYLTDNLGNRTKHLIAPLSFIGAGTNAWQRFVADSNIGAGADHVNFGLRAEGEEIGLSATNGAPIDSIPNFGQQTSGVSQGRLLDGEATIVSFPGTPSPGDPNYILMNNVVISEVLTHTDLPFEDAIEIQNVGPSPVNVSGWWLSDSRGSPRKYQIPITPPIPSGGFKVFYEYQFNDRDVAPIPFALSSAGGDEVYLSAATNNALTGVRAQAEFPAAENGVPFGRYRASQGYDFTALSRRTFGQDNPPNVEMFRTGTGLSNAYPKVGPIVISEIMYHPPDIMLTNDNVVEEFVELHNVTNVTVNLYDPANPTNRWRLRDGVDFDFPGGINLAPGGYLLVVSFDPQNNAPALAAFRAKYGSNSVVLGPYSGKLDNGGEGIKLLKPDAPQPDGRAPYILVDFVSYSDRAPWPTNADGFGMSLQRVHVLGYGNDPTNWLAAAPTPGPSGVLDSDGDGMPNSWENLYMFNPNNPNDADDDPDNDGMTNLEEYMAGTHPRQAGSRLRVESITSSGANVTLQFNAASNKTYTVQYRTSLSTGSWVLLNSVPASPTNVLRTINDSGAGGSAQRYYRVLTP
ncbi:MAG: lamin tail domain-containing protein [Verrucomicrobia subdivision 3 bacterium]|nr:lamin tail domain-containing protein [Limisphaerales bacterium]